ncbi:hypothetical protein I302_103684 [Kwoniella bestiolae CBS 10118]|uniref:Uncharacterized protein n=1 Tax=Kwoniella bestiolae CBS 10118 TaxID=1296100 RepID=A0A1B9G959_9TREE|nr:hypothetical protein I302_02389 [Kwoniella bestiolae CBS 10118]OCF27547.1 hypothetical protein I302_02389 [Kwoniella bestiolae CBS 10118]
MSQPTLRKYKGPDSRDGTSFGLTHRKAKDGTWYQTLCSKGHGIGHDAQEYDPRRDPAGKMTVVIPFEATDMEERSVDPSNPNAPYSVDYYIRRAGGHWNPRAIRAPSSAEPPAASTDNSAYP